MCVKCALLLLILSLVAAVYSLKNEGRRAQNRTSLDQSIEALASKPVEDELKKSISQIKCEEYSANVSRIDEVIDLIPTDKVRRFGCDLQGQHFYFGGGEAEIGEFPHMAAIGWPITNGPGYAWLCGGSLISERYVLTAAHCFHEMISLSTESGRPSVVRLGDQDLTDGLEDGAAPITVGIDDVIVHPGFRSPYKYHDIALLKLAKDIEITFRIRPACIFLNTPLIGKLVIATDWGKTALKADSSSVVLRKASFEVFANEECQSSVPQTRTWNDVISGDQLCAGDPRHGGRDMCQGNSGGPIQVIAPDQPCVFHVVGVMGFGGGCTNPKGIAVYAAVARYVDWIERVVWGASLRG